MFDFVEQVGTLVGYPVYVFGDEWVDKYMSNGGKTRYLFSSDTNEDNVVDRRCSCMGWMRFKNCKHLRMLRGDWGWLKNSGVIPEYLMEFLPVLDVIIPNCLERFCNQLKSDADLLGFTPEYVSHISIKLPSDVNALSVVAIHTFADGRQFALDFR